MSARALFLLMALAPLSCALAADPDPPGRVARLSFMRGAVSFQAMDATNPEDAVLNRPLTSGDRIMTAGDSRAELTLGNAAIRLDERTDLPVSNLDSDIAQLEANSGVVA